MQWMCLRLCYGRIAFGVLHGKEVVIMKLFHKVADRMVSMLVPTATAQAGPCACGSPYGTTLDYEWCACVNHALKYRRKWCDGCNFRYDACLTVDYC